MVPFASRAIASGGLDLLFACESDEWLQGYLDLNSVPEAGSPVRIGGVSEAQRSGPLPCCTRTCGSVEIDLRLPRTGLLIALGISPHSDVNDSSLPSEKHFRSSVLPWRKCSKLLRWSESMLPAFADS